MKTTKERLLGALLGIVAILTVAQGIPGPYTTPYTQLLLTAPNAATARTTLGIGGSGTNTVVTVSSNYLAKADGLGSLTNSIVYATATGVGIGTTSLNAKLHIIGSSEQEFIVGASTGNPDISLEESGTTKAQIIYDTTNNGTLFRVNDAGVVGNENNLFLQTGGNVGIGTTSFGTSAAKVLSIGSGTAPTTSPADVAQTWVADQNAVAGNAAFSGRSESGATFSLGRTNQWSAPFAFTASTIQTNAAGTAFRPNSSKIKVFGSGGGAVTITATPSITAGVSGLTIIIQGTSDAATITLQDEASLAGSKLELAGSANVTLGKGDTLMLEYDSVDVKWYEVSRSNN